MADTSVLDAAWKAQGNSGDRPAGWFGTGGSSNNPNYGGGVNASAGSGNIQQQYMEAAKPAISSLQSSIPEIQSTYSTTRNQLTSSKQNLSERYKSILSDLSNRQNQEVTAQTKVTSGELGKRGITGSSTLAQQEIQGAVQPINQNYATLSTNTGLAQNEALQGIDNSIANLANQETSSIRDVYNTIGQLQTSSGQGGIQAALQQYAQQEQARQAAAQLALQQSQLEQSKAQQAFENNFQSQIQPLQLQQLRSQITRSNQPADTGLDLSGLMGLFGGSSQPSGGFSTNNTAYNPKQSQPNFNKYVSQ